MKLRAFNARRAEMYGHKLTPVQRMILHRSDPHIHIEDQFSELYDKISFSATLEDGFARFKQIGYSHPEFWDTVEIPMTEDEEKIAYSEAAYVNNMEYDRLGVLSQASDWDIIKPDPDKTWCSKACARVICAAKPDFGAELERLGYKDFNIDPADLYMIAKYWFEIK